MSFYYAGALVLGSLLSMDPVAALAASACIMSLSFPFGAAAICVSAAFVAVDLSRKADSAFVSFIGFVSESGGGLKQSVRLALGLSAAFGSIVEYRREGTKLERAAAAARRAAPAAVVGASDALCSLAGGIDLMGRAIAMKSYVLSIIDALLDLNRLSSGIFAAWFQR